MRPFTVVSAQLRPLSPVCAVGAQFDMLSFRPRRVYGIESFVQPVNEMGERERSSKVRELEEKREAVDNGNKRSTSNVEMEMLGQWADGGREAVARRFAHSLQARQLSRVAAAMSSG